MTPSDTPAIAIRDSMHVSRFPLHSNGARALALAPGYGTTLLLSGPIVRFFVHPTLASPGATPARTTRFDSGAVIGKCENILALTFILAGDTTALGLLFAAKSLVRGEDIKKDPTYFLGGFLINVVWSVLMGYVLRWIVVGA